MPDMFEQDIEVAPTFRPGLLGTELREAQRTPIQCQVFYMNLEGQGQGKIANISKNGCLVEGNMSVKEGDKMTLVLHHPAAPHLIVIDKARVVWTNGTRFGLVHETVYPSELGQLNTLLKSSRTL